MSYPIELIPIVNRDHSFPIRLGHLKHIPDDVLQLLFSILGKEFQSWTHKTESRDRGVYVAMMLPNDKYESVTITVRESSEPSSATLFANYIFGQIYFGTHCIVDALKRFEKAEKKNGS